jgi:hypothetical protein
MKRPIISVLVVVSYFLGMTPTAGQATTQTRASGPCAAGAKILDDNNGFRGMNFDSTPAQTKGLVAGYQSEFKTKRVTVLTQKPGGMLYGENVESIDYYYFNDHLFLIKLHFSDSDADDILAGFSRALMCDVRYETASSGKYEIKAIRAAGRRVRLTAEYWKAVSAYSGNPSFADAIFEKVGVRKVVEAAVQHEAAEELRRPSA